MKDSGLYERLRGVLSDDMSRVEAYMRDTLTYVRLLQPMRTIIEELLTAPGKQIRPMLTLLAARALGAGEAQKEKLIKLGALLAIVHMASLMHDDVVDDAPLRRGLPTVQETYGKNIAVYTGDFLLSRVLSALLKGGMNRSGEEIALAVEKMCIGETVQMEMRFDADTTEEQYLGMIRGKTVALFTAAFRIAGIECAVSDGIMKKLSELGICFGYVFQLRDDLLDYVSDAKSEGKAVHADLRAGYYTLPLLYTLQGKDGAALKRILEKKGHMDEENERDVMRMIREADALGYTKERIDAYAARALTLLAECADGEDTARIKEVMTWLTKSIRI